MWKIALSSELARLSDTVCTLISEFRSTYEWNKQINDEKTYTLLSKIWGL